MSDYTELVKALRERAQREDEYYEHGGDVINDAAAAIEALQALLTEADKKQTYQHDCICELTAENEELQAEVDELKQKNTDLLNVREVSNDDMERILEVLRNIPVGPIESIVEQLPKRGEWIKHEDDACECSVCGLGLNSFVEGIFYNFCPFCGADMRAKMEVEE